MIFEGKEITPSVYTLAVYEQEFGSDMLQDLFGGMPAFDDENSELALISSVGWLTACKVLWALCRTADDSTPSFNVWSRKYTSVNLMDVFTELMPAISDAFFHTRLDEADSE